MKRIVAVPGAVALVLIAGVALVRVAGHGDDSTATPMTAVGPGAVVASVSATGNLVAAQQLTLDFPNPGRLVEVGVKAGDKVGKGQVLARIDDRAAQDDLARANAAADDANARLALDRPGSLELISDRVAVATAAAELHAAERALADTSLVAPIDGIVTAVANRPGELVGAAGPRAAGDPAASGFMVLSDVSTLPLRAAFSEADSIGIRQGQKAQVTFDALPGRTVEATVDSVLISPNVVNNVVTYPVTVVFPLFDGARPGMTANVSVVVDQHDASLVIPNAAIATVGEFTEVVVVKGRHQAYRQVHLGARGDTVSEVVSGLQPGERILADKPVAHEPDGDVIPPPVPGAAQKAGA